MSLNRIASLETFATIPRNGRPRSDSVASGRSRKLTFNPLPEAWDTRQNAKDDAVHAVGAFEVPHWKRVLQVAVTVLYCFFAAGVVFGYAAIKPVFKKEGVYHNYCLENRKSDHEVDFCVELHLNRMFTVAAVATNVVALPTGMVLDKYGPRVCGVTGAVFLAIGASLLAYSTQLAFDAYLYGYLFLALGGPLTYISSYHLSNAFPQNSGLILALLTGAFDASSALFLLYRLVYEGTDGHFDHTRFFTWYLVVPVVIVLLQFFVLPRHSYKTVGELVETAEHAEIENDMEVAVGEQAVIDETTALLHHRRRAERENIVAEIEEILDNDTADRQALHEERKNTISGVWGVLHSKSIREQLRSPWFLLICLFTMIQMLRINYFVATIRPQYEAIFGNHEKAVAINDFFDLALPLGGIISIPFIGLFLDNFSSVTVLSTLVTIATLIGALGLTSNQPAAYIGVCLFVLYRPFYYTAVSDYSSKVFGFRTFGTVYGTIICLSGLFTFTQAELDHLFHITFNNNPLPVNEGLMGVALVIGIALVSFVYTQSHRIERDLLESEVERAVFRQ